MFPYLRTAEDFIKDCGGETVKCDNSSSECKECNRKSELVEWLEKSVRKANWRNYIKEGEVKAWCQSVCFYMKKVISEVIKNNPDLKLAIGLEYYLETRVNFGDEKKPHYRADFMIGGYGKDGNGEPEMRVLVIELKQYSEISQIIEETGKIKWKWEYNDDSELEEQPNSQVKFYAENLNDSVNNKEDKNIKFIPCVYMHNLEANKICAGNYEQEGRKCGCVYSCDDNILEDENVVYDDTPVKVFLKGSDFASHIRGIFDCEGNGLDVFKEIRRRYQTFSMGELADILTCEEDKLKEYEKRLRPDQFFILNGYVDNKEWDNYIKNHINYINWLKDENRDGKERYKWKSKENKGDQSFNGNSILDIIEGGPGSGKTLLAMFIIRECLDQGLNVSFINYKSAPKNAIKRYLCREQKKTAIREDVFENKYIDSFAGDNADVYILDEAHTFNKDISGIIKTKMDDDQPRLFICMYDKGQILNEDIGCIEKIEAIDGFEKDDNEIKCNTSKVNQCNKYKIWSQFRCNKDEGFVSWIEYKFKIKNDYYPRPFSKTLKSFDFNVKIIDENDLQGDILNEIKPEIENGRIFVLSDCLDNARIQSLLHLEKTVWKPQFPGNLKSSKKNILYVGDTTTICGIENEEILVFVKDVYKNNKIICDEITKNKYRILLTRGLKKCYIVTCDKGLKKYLLE